MTRQIVRKLLRHLTPRDLTAIREIGRIGAERGARIFLVGGAVRDLLVGLPVRDLDLAVEGPLGALVEAWEERHGRVERVHGRFGTATVALPSGGFLDLAETRSETYASSGALPTVARAPLGEDLARRDFALNAMAIHLDPGAFGLLVDPLGGAADLAAKRLRVLHDRSFLDDPTRAFRAVQLSVRFGFRVERETAKRLRTAVRAGAVERISSHRLRREIEKLLGGPRASRAAVLLADLGLLQAMRASPRIDVATARALRKADRARRWYEEHLEQRLVAEPVEWWIVPAAILAGALPARKRRALVDRWAPDRRARAVLLGSRDEARRLERALLGPRGATASGIRSVCAGIPVETLLVAIAQTRSARAADRIRRFLATLRFTRLDIDGRDLLGAGATPGPGIARGLDAALRAKLDGRAPTARGQLDVALRAARRSRLRA